MKKAPNERKRTCGECIHEFACQMWNIGHLHNTDATNCSNYETVKDSAAYLIGLMDGRKEQEESVCDFCKDFDFGTASCRVDKYGTGLNMAGGCYRFPEEEQFNFCPKCGRSRKDILKVRVRAHEA